LVVVEHEKIMELDLVLDLLMHQVVVPVVQIVILVLLVVLAVGVVVIQVGHKL
jgi:hypothetical protein